jgi:hypothetical protein
MSPVRIRAILTVLCCAAAIAAGAWHSVGANAQVSGREWYVSADGSPAGDGSRGKPIDLASALDGRRVKPGSTVWLRGGIYRGPFTSLLTGTADAPITVRSAAGERAVVADDRERADGGTLNVKGAWTIYRDFDVTNTNENRGHAVAFRPMGLEVQAPHTRFINLAIYDTGMGFGFWKESVDAELYGNVIFNSGSENTTADLRHGHGIYLQNETGTKLIRENIIVNQFGFGIHAYPNPGGQVGMHFEGNVIANSGAANPPGNWSRYDNLLVSAYRPYQADRIELIDNFTYLPRREKLRNRFPDANVCLGCTDPQQHKSIVVRGNYFAGGAPVAIVAGWQTLTMRDNTFVGRDGMAGAAVPPSGSRWDWDHNTYIGTGAAATPDRLFILGTKLLTSSEWTKAGFDRDSTFRPEPPTGVQVFVRPNAEEAGRAHIIVYNWDLAARASVDLRKVLTRGARYEVVNAMDYLGSPVASGVYDGTDVAIPLTGLTVAQPRGTRGTPSDRMGEFAVFVVRAPTGAAPSVPRTTAPPAAAVPQPAASALTRFTGRFISRNPPAEITVVLEGAVLRATILNEKARPVFRLVEITAGRYSLEGAPAGTMAVFDTGGPVTRLTIIRPGAPSVILERQ